MKILKYGADWCGPCRNMSNILKENFSNYKEIDVDEHPEFLTEKHINNIPYIEIVDDSDNILYSHIGPLTKDELNSTLKALSLKNANK